MITPSNSITAPKDNQTDRAALSLQSDEELIGACANRGELALQILFERHARLVRSIALRSTGIESEADDIVQDVFLEAWAQAHRFCATKGAGLAWISTLARRRAIDRLRRRQAYTRAQERLCASGAEFDCPAPEQADEFAIRSERASVVHRALALLPAAQREAVQLAFFQGFSQRQIAAHTSTPLGTIKTRIELALRKIREALGVRAGAPVAEMALV